MRSASDPRDAKHSALALLTRREHSRIELTRKLQARGIEAEQARAAIESLSEDGWQSDKRFAESLARSRASGGYGPLRIRAELAQHKLPSELIESAITACEIDWNARAAELLARRFGRKPTRDRNEQAKRGQFLQRRGFDLEAIRTALKGLPDESGIDYD
jgi:regulatory protein